MTQQFINRFLMVLVVVKGRSARTIEAYRGDLETFLAFIVNFGRTFESMSASDIEEFVSYSQGQGVKPSSIARRLSVIHSFCTWMVDEGIRADDPTARLASYKAGVALPRALPESYFVALLDGIDGTEPLDYRDRLLIELLYGTGARVSEAVNVKWSDVDLDERLLRVTGKGSRQRLVPLGGHLIAALRAYLDSGAYSSLTRKTASEMLLVNARGENLSRHGVNEILLRRARALGLPTNDLHAHAFRHSCATHMIEHGADIRVVQELLGHASIVTTQRYTAVAVGTLVAQYEGAHPRAMGDL